MPEPEPEPAPPPVDLSPEPESPFGFEAPLTPEPESPFGFEPEPPAPAPPEPESPFGFDEPPPPPPPDDFGLDMEPPPAPPAPEFPLDIPEPEPMTASSTDDLVDDAPVPPPPAPAPAPAPVAAAAPAVPADLLRVLEEVESYVSLGFVDDAKVALRDISTRYPGHPAIVDKLHELGFEEDALAEAPSDGGDLFGQLEPPPPAAPPEPAGGDAESLLGLGAAPADASVDLNDELSGLFSTQSAVETPEAGNISSELDAGLADIFKEFKRGVDKQLSREDYDTRYNLGIAYKEMGLVDEAIAEFQLAAKDDNRLLECSSMLGICFMEKGMPKLAVKWFEKGLTAEGRGEEEYKGLRYDLAMAYEAAGEPRRALSLFEEIYGLDANFRDVSGKVRELRAQN